nr:hypothetical protein [Tanacetum cinerariifolium]
MNQNTDTSSFDQIQTPQFPFIHPPSQEISEEKVKNIVDQPTERETRITESLQNFRVIHKKSSTSLNKTTQISSVHAIAPVLPTEEPEYSLSVGYEHLSTTPKTELDEVIEFSAKKLEPIPSKYEFDFLEEFSGAFMPTSISDEKRIRREHEEYINLMEKLFTINSVPRPLENFHANTIVETLPTSPIPDDPSFPHPPPKPPDVEFFFEPNPREVIAAVMNNINELNEDECFNPGGEIDVFANVEDDDYFLFMFVIRIFLPYLIYPEVSPLLFSPGSEETIFDHGISV